MHAEVNLRPKGIIQPTPPPSLNSHVFPSLHAVIFLVEHQRASISICFSHKAIVLLQKTYRTPIAKTSFMIIQWCFLLCYFWSFVAMVTKNICMEKSEQLSVCHKKINFIWFWIESWHESKLRVANGNKKHCLTRSFSWKQSCMFVNSQ